jgi:CheY-like chemotaxis protein
MTLALWGGVELVISSIIEPWLYAARAGISSLAILLSAAFWTVLWGPIGLVLSTPLTVCLVVLGRHVPQLEFLYILFGDEPVLAPEASYYQRLLTFNEDEAREVLDDFLKEKSLVELYDTVLIPALSLVEHDRHNGTLDDERQKFIFRATREIIEDLPEDQPAGEVNERPRSDVSILCVPARDEADELVGLMLAQVLGAGGYEVRVIPAGFVKDMLAAVVREKPDIIFISAVPPSTISHARSICRRVRQRLPEAKPVVGLWGSRNEIAALQERLGPGCSDYVVNSLSQAELQVRLIFPEANEEASQTEAKAHANL